MSTSLNTYTLYSDTIINVGDVVITPNVNQKDINAVGMHIWTNVSNFSGTNTTIKFKMQSLEEISNTWLDINSIEFKTQTTDSLDLMTIYPGVVFAPYESVSIHMSYNWRIVATVTCDDTPSIDATISIQLLR